MENFYAELRPFIIDQLVNNQVSTDAEMIALFVSEGLDTGTAIDIVETHRDRCLCDPFYTPEI